VEVGRHLGWDFPMVAMTAPTWASANLAIDAPHDGYAKNTWLPTATTGSAPTCRSTFRATAGYCWGGAHGAAGAFPESWNARWEGLG